MAVETAKEAESEGSCIPTEVVSTNLLPSALHVQAPSYATDKGLASGESPINFEQNQTEILLVKLFNKLWH